MSFETLLTDLGARIGKIMQMKGISKEEMMSKLDCDERTLRRILRGETATTFNRVNEIAKALDVELNMIIKVSNHRISFKKNIESFNQ
jgi:transcriptional regulator with XRE-family HTH domain